jgi:hypothetical protein
MPDSNFASPVDNAISNVSEEAVRTALMSMRTEFFENMRVVGGNLNITTTKLAEQAAASNADKGNFMQWKDSAFKLLDKLRQMHEAHDKSDREYQERADAEMKRSRDDWAKLFTDLQTSVNLRFNKWQNILLAVLFSFCGTLLAAVVSLSVYIFTHGVH